MKLELYPTPINATVGEIRVIVNLTKSEISRVNKMSSDERNQYLKAKATVQVTDFSADFYAPELSEWDVCK